MSQFVVQDIEAKRVTFHVGGVWSYANDKIIRKQISQAVRASSKKAHIKKPAFIECSDLEKMDSAGAVLIIKLHQELKDAGFEAIEVEGLTHDDNALIKNLMDTPDDEHEVYTPDTFMYHMARLGKFTVSTVGRILDGLGFFGLIALAFMQGFVSKDGFRRRSIVRHMRESGVDALPIVALMAFLISIVLAYQGVIQLRAFGAEIYTINLTAISILREMGVLLTAILVAGRSGSAFAAEIGVMKLNEEVDAMQTMGLSPMRVLVLPRVIALIIVLPILTFFADIAGIIGSAFSVALLVGVPLEQFMAQMQAGITVWTFLVGLIKAPFFGLLIAFVGTYSGMSASGSAENVGRMTTSAVVWSIFLVIFADALFSILFQMIGI